jgi:tRNA modification GTPase
LQRPTETICAIATPPGAGGLGIVRLSGPLVPDIAMSMVGRLPAPRYAMLADFLDGAGEIIDTGIVLWFPAPRSFTGEDVLELQGHGGAFILQRLVERALELGARLAEPGEFSQRAFLNDKLDLVQAEAIADLIESGTAAAARAAQRTLQGVFSEQVNALQAELTALRVFVEAAIDFPEEEIDFLAESDVDDRIRRLGERVADLLREARQGRLLRDGIVLAIIGPPNAGKSSLLNALSGQDRAIVTAIPGTTRDVLREQIDLDGIPVHVADTAGIRETRDEIEAEGVRRALQTLETADVVLLVEDVSDAAIADPSVGVVLPPGATCLRVGNKIDLLSAEKQREICRAGGPERVWISVRTGQGLDLLRQRIRAIVGAASGAESGAGGNFSARQRHVDALKRAGGHVAAGFEVLTASGAGELLAEELRLAQQALGEITGEMLADDLLGEIFASFCIGK